MFTTAEAAEQLGVSARRVRALIAAGDLPAQRVGSQWLLDEDAVRARAQAPRRAGRPRGGEKDARAIGGYLLMNRDHTVARFSYSRTRQHVVALEPLDDAAWAPPGACVPTGKLHADRMSAWIESRLIPRERPHLAELMAGLGLANNAELAFASLGLSLSDQYWFKPVDAETGEPLPLSWAEVNYFDNGFDDVVGAAMMGGNAASAGMADRSPSNTTNGMLAKRWVQRDGRPFLLKGSTHGMGREPHSELLATRLCQRLLASQDYVPYELVFEDGAPCSLCPDMVDATTELIPAADVVGCYGLREPGLYEPYVQLVSELAGRDLRQSIDKMIVCDYLMCNDDRHLYNFGLIRDVESLQVLGAAPLFDNGCAFFARATLAQLRAPRFFYTAHPFAERPLGQLALAQDYSWFDADALEGFADEVAEVLSGNENLPGEFAELAAVHVQRAIEQVVEFAAEAHR